MTAILITTRSQSVRMCRLRSLVEELQRRDMSRDDIRSLLGLSGTGSRRYIANLRAVLTVARRVGATPNSRGQYVYRIDPDAERVERHLAAVEAGEKPGATQAQSEIQIAARTPGRRFHILADDAKYAIRVHRGPVARDPLVAAFFGAVAMEARV
jgi:hypothetical protein